MANNKGFNYPTITKTSQFMNPLLEAKTIEIHQMKPLNMIIYNKINLINRTLRKLN